MNREQVDRIADAVLYEGYILYPYRPAIKNRQRWTFGGLYPEAYCQGREGDSCSHQTECLVRGQAATGIEAVVRFLHLTNRLVGEMPNGVSNPGDSDAQMALPVSDAVDFRPVESLQVGEQMFHSWQEAEEREVSLGEVMLGEVLANPHRVLFRFAGSLRWETLRGADGALAGMLRREQQMIEGCIDLEAAQIEDGLFRLTLRVLNTTPLAEGERASRDEALLRSLVSAHTILGVRDGAFISLLDPPDTCRAAAAACRNVGVWPVLVGADGQTDILLASPIILYDYPQLAPESPGDFFDSTEIDEMLTLRILTLTDEEKRVMAAVDARARNLLERTERMAPARLGDLHGTIRALRPVPEEDANG